MKFKGTTKKILGSLLAAATLVALAPMSAANADSPANAPVHVNIPQDGTANTSITLVGSPNALRGHVFKALRIGTYEAAQADGPAPSGSVTSVVVDTEKSMLKATNAALAQMNEPVDPHYKDNPIGQVASKWLGYRAKGNTDNQDKISNSFTHAWGGRRGDTEYSGKLRQYVTFLAHNSDFKNAVANEYNFHSGQINQNAQDSSKSTMVLKGIASDGIYMLIDATDPSSGAGGTNSIPMLVSTDVAGYTNVAGADDITLGTVSMKNDDTWVDMSANNKNGLDNTVAKGGLVQFKMSGHAPMGTGFHHFTYIMTNRLSKGFSLQKLDSVKIDNRIVDMVSPSNPNGMYTYTTKPVPDSEGGGTDLIFDFSKRILDQPFTGNIQIDFTAKVDSSSYGPVSSSAGLTYSNDPENQPDPSQGKTGSLETLGKGTGGKQMIFYFSGVQVQSMMGSAENAVPSISTYSLIDDRTNNALSFEKSADGSYALAGKNEAHSTQQITSATGASSLPKGRLKVDGLTFGTYTLKQVSNGGSNSLAGKVLPSVKVTVSPKKIAGGFSDPSVSVYTNEPDRWGLVQQDSFKSGVLPVRTVSSVSQLPLSGFAGTLLLVTAAIAVALLLAVVAILRRRSSQTRAE